MKKIWKRNFLILFSGLVFGHALTVLLLPLFTVVFSPEMFGEFSYYAYFTAFISVPITLGYESQITNSKTKEDAYILIKLVLFLSLAIGFICAVFVLWPLYSLLELTEAPLLFALLTAASACAANVVSGYQFLCVKYQKYTRLSVGNFMNQGVRATSQLMCGWLFLSSVGMIIGDIVGRIIAAISIIFHKFSFSQMLKPMNITEFKTAIHNHKSDSSWYMLSGLLEMTITWFPFLALGSLYGVKEAGMAALVIRLLVVPSGIVGKVIADVYHGGVNDYQEKISKFGLNLSRYILLVIFCFSVASVSLFYWLFFAVDKEILLHFLPNEWHGIYTILAILIPIVIVQFSTQSFTRYAIMSGLNKWKFYFYTILFFLLCGLYLFAATYKVPLEVMLQYYVATNVVMHIIYYGLILTKNPISVSS